MPSKHPRHPLLVRASAKHRLRCSDVPDRLRRGRRGHRDSGVQTTQQSVTAAEHLPRLHLYLPPAFVVPLRLQALHTHRHLEDALRDKEGRVRHQHMLLYLFAVPALDHRHPDQTTVLVDVVIVWQVRSVCPRSCRLLCSGLLLLRRRLFKHRHIVQHPCRHDRLCLDLLGRFPPSLRRCMPQRSQTDERLSVLLDALPLQLRRLIIELRTRR